ncbi:hypothetical protein PFISCL1PPCAC_29194, partial [Pristionchus fissidentatus]
PIDSSLPSVVDRHLLLPYPSLQTSIMSTLSSVLLIALVSGAAALTCYENDDNGNTYERTNESWKYCSLIPFASASSGGRLNGVGPTVENLEGYNAMFGQSSKMYRVLSLCIYERYDFGSLSNKIGPHPEFMFRCFCNYDRCNSATTFASFLSTLRTDNQ